MYSRCTCTIIQSFNKITCLNLFNKIKAQILAIPEISQVHDIHLWSLDGEKDIFTVHLKVKKIEKKDFISKLGLDYVKCSYPTISINDAAALIQKLDIIISPDTSIVHIAASFDVPTVSIHENNKDSYQLFAPTSEINRTVFAETNEGIIGFSVSQLLKYCDELMKIIK